MTDAIVAEGLAKQYGDVVALDGMELPVPEGTVFVLVGPNGAGKTIRPRRGRRNAQGREHLEEF